MVNSCREYFENKLQITHLKNVQGNQHELLKLKPVEYVLK